MKAKVKATGEIVEVEQMTGSLGNLGYYRLKGSEWHKYASCDLDFNYYKPNYWERLMHQAAIAAMQGKMAQGDNFGNSREDVCNKIADYCIDVADALIKKLKEKEERK